MRNVAHTQMLDYTEIYVLVCSVKFICTGWENVQSILLPRRASLQKQPEDAPMTCRVEAPAGAGRIWRELPPSARERRGTARIPSGRGPAPSAREGTAARGEGRRGRPGRTDSEEKIRIWISDSKDQNGEESSS
jgi:hypothetical protein